MMNHSRQCAFFGLVLIWVILTPGAITAADVGGVYDCNPPWGYGDKVTITFRIDRSQYPSKCGPGTTAGRPVFLTSPDGVTFYLPNCTVTTDIRSSCTFTPGAIGCGCTNSNSSGFYVVEYNFIFGPDYPRYWKAEIACLDSSFTPAITFANTDSNCKLVVITAVEVGGVYVCNPPWSNGDKVTITFRIDRSQYPSKCDPISTAGKPVFQSSPDGKVTYGANCTVTTDIRTRCTFTTGTIGCGCTNSDDNGFYVVEYNFIFGPDYHRYWEAEITCLDSNFVPAIAFTNTDSNCKPVARAMTVMSQQPAASGGEGSRIPNADGLSYSTVDFTEEQRQKGKHHASLRDNTDYVSLDFAEMAETARKMSKK